MLDRRSWPRGRRRRICGGGGDCSGVQNHAGDTRMKGMWTLAAVCASLLAALPVRAQQQQSGQAAVGTPGVAQSPFVKVRTGREAGNNTQILTTGIRELKPDGSYPQPLPSNHALIITVSEYQRSPLPGVLTDRKLGIELACRFGVPTENIVELSERQVT